MTYGIKELVPEPLASSIQNEEMTPELETFDPETAVTYLECGCLSRPLQTINPDEIIDDNLELITMHLFEALHRIIELETAILVFVEGRVSKVKDDENVPDDIIELALTREPGLFEDEYDDPDMLVNMSDGTTKRVGDLVSGDKLLGSDGVYTIEKVKSE